jgi:hypothetical protein
MSVIVTPVSCFSVNSMASPFSPSPSRFGSSCANDEGSSADSSQHHRHHGGSGRYGHGQGGTFDQSNPSGSASMVPRE